MSTLRLSLRSGKVKGSFSAAAPSAFIRRNGVFDSLARYHLTEYTSCFCLSKATKVVLIIITWGNDELVTVGGSGDGGGGLASSHRIPIASINDGG